MRINYISKQNFKSGLSKTNILLLSQVKPQKVEKYFSDVFDIKTDFKNNQTIATLNLLCAKILQKLSKEKIFGDFNLFSKPSQIRVFKPIETAKNIQGDFCNITSAHVIKGKIAPPISLFFQNDTSTLAEINKYTNFSKQQNIISSDNFLSLTIHEWMHVAHLKHLYQNIVQDEKEMKNFIQAIKKMEFSPSEKRIIQELLGSYIYRNGNINPMEVIAEGLTKTICDCLDEKKIKLVNSPNEVLKKYPKEFTSLLYKILSFNDF